MNKLSSDFHNQKEENSKLKAALGNLSSARCQQLANNVLLLAVERLDSSDEELQTAERRRKVDRQSIEGKLRGLFKRLAQTAEVSDILASNSMDVTDFIDAGIRGNTDRNLEMHLNAEHLYAAVVEAQRELLGVMDEAKQSFYSLKCWCCKTCMCSCQRKRQQQQRSNREQITSCLTVGLRPPTTDLSECERLPVVMGDAKHLFRELCVRQALLYICKCMT
eukprot:TRINITY_DN6889_c0_g1_i1.p1 TRINITY_DN6889_c0_g1~~TRINITY_DN6889_c0_g1_i1.p1  ORF type:complete len:221 (-),score=42.94 TRINITY_DN6889_c0_g1_i1:4-666(-)